MLLDELDEFGSEDDVLPNDDDELGVVDVLPDVELVAGCVVVDELEVWFWLGVCACRPSAAANSTDAPQVMNIIGFFMVSPD